MYHIMREDARRRFVFGVTIEGDQMRLWYCDRSDVLASAPLNWFEVSTLASLWASLKPTHA